MKMAVAFTERFSKVRLITNGGILNKGTADTKTWYGLSRSVEVVRLPLYLRESEALLRRVDTARFVAFAALYSRFLRGDLVYSRSPRAGALSVRLGNKTIIEEHANPEEEIIPTVVPIAKRPSFLGVVTVNEYIKAEYVRAGIPGNKVFVAPDAADVEQFRSAKSRIECRRLLGICIEQPVVMYMGHFYPEKGIETALESARLLPSVQFLFVGGWTEDADRLRSSARLLPNVSVTDFVSNDRVPFYLAAADILLLPNSGRYQHAYYASPLKLFEYMAANRPIVASNVPAFVGVLEHRRNAYLVAPDDPDSMANGIVDILSNAALRMRIVADASDYVGRHSWRHRVDRILEEIFA